MSVLAKPISSLTTEDLAVIADEEPIEGVRLEFKREHLTREKLLKEVSALANTFGGDIIVGATEKGDGRLDMLSGCDLPKGYRQTIVQWCQTGLEPPLTPLVSSAVPSPTDTGKACLVIRVPESPAAPHFIQGRKGCYVRTDEHNKRFEPDLATSAELTHLADRRATAAAKVDFLFERSLGRLEYVLRNEYHARSGVVGEPGARLIVQLAPAFPVEPLVDLATLRELALDAVLQGQSQFPYVHEAFSQHESMVAIKPCGQFEFTDASVFGSFFYCDELEHIDQAQDPPHRHAWFGHIAADVFDSLLYFRAWSHALGYEGNVAARLELIDVRGVSFELPTYPGFIRWTNASRSRLDNEVSMRFAWSQAELSPDNGLALREALVRIAHALGWEGLTADQEWARLQKDLYRRRGLTVPGLGEGGQGVPIG